MSDDSTQGDGFAPGSVTGRIDAICDRFEAAWKKGAGPTIREYLGEIPEPSRGDLFRELLLLELAYRQQQRERPKEDEYRRRFPQHERQIAEAFSRLPDQAGPEETVDLKPARSRALHIRCPHCHNPIELLDDNPLEEIACPSCGSSFGLVGDEALAFETTGGTRHRRQSFAHFELIEQLGAGAFGVVWRAHDTQLDRVVALKIPRKGQLSREETEMFMREARAAAQLRHANIVSVHEVGLEDDTVYTVSDFVEGLSLSDHLTGQRYTYRESAELCARIAEAIHFAHEQGVIHRDLKPSNILMDGSGEPHIVDFGLAKRESGEITMTMDGQVLGTPAYMSPEQAKGEGHAADRRTDVYSQGVILFELLTGERPFRGNVRMLLKQVMEDESPQPRKLDRNIPRDLETICLKCLEKEPGRRYQTAKQLAEDLGRFLDGKPVRARSIGRVARAWRYCKRHKALTFWIGAFIASMLYPLILGIVAIASGLAITWYTWTMSSQAGFESARGSMAEDGTLILPGVNAERVAMFEEVLEWDGAEATVFRFAGGPSGSGVFHAGGQLRVWVELDKDGETQEFFEQVFDLKTDPTDTTTTEATYALMRHDRRQDGSEYWRAHSTVRDATRTALAHTEYKAVSPIAESSLEISAESTSSLVRGESSTAVVQVWSEPEWPTLEERMALLTKRKDITPEELAMFARELVERSGSNQRHASSGGLLTKRGVDTCLFEATAGFGLVLDSFRRKNGFPEKDEKPDHVIRVMCRLLTDREAEELSAPWSPFPTSEEE